MPGMAGVWYFNHHKKNLGHPPFLVVRDLQSRTPRFIKPYQKCIFAKKTSLYESIVGKIYHAI